MTFRRILTLKTVFCVALTVFVRVAFGRNYVKVNLSRANKTPNSL